MKSYPNYKPSGFEWLGDIPSHWGVIKSKWLFSDFSKKNFPNEQLLSATQEQGVIPRDMLENKVTMPLGELVNFKLVQKGDFVISLRSFQGGIEYSNYQGLVSPAYTVLKSKIKIHKPYFRYLFKSKFYIDELNTAITGIRDGKNINYKDFAQLFLPLPTLEEQTAIANFLNYKSSQIDRFIANKEKLIQLLKEQRTAVINNAVTKGIDPDVKLKPSGIEWLGDIPEHWIRLPLKRIVKVKITDGPHETPPFVEEGIPFISAEAIKGNKIDFNYRRGNISKALCKEYSKKCKPEFNDIFLVKSGSTTGKVAKVNVDFDFAIWSPLALIRPKLSIATPDFLFFAMQSNAFQKQIQLNWSFGTQPNIGMGVIERLNVVLPPIEEQNEIIDFLNRETSKIDAAITQAQQEIKLIKEYRQTLIANAVTGKIDVRDEG